MHAEESDWRTARNDGGPRARENDMFLLNNSSSEYRNLQFSINPARVMFSSMGEPQGQQPSRFEAMSRLPRNANADGEAIDRTDSDGFSFGHSGGLVSFELDDSDINVTNRDLLTSPLEENAYSRIPMANPPSRQVDDPSQGLYSARTFLEAYRLMPYPSGLEQHVSVFSERSLPPELIAAPIPTPYDMSIFTSVHSKLNAAMDEGGDGQGDRGLPMSVAEKKGLHSASGWSKKPGAYVPPKVPEGHQSQSPVANASGSIEFSSSAEMGHLGSFSKNQGIYGSGGSSQFDGFLTRGRGSASPPDTDTKRSRFDSASKPLAWRRGQGNEQQPISQQLLNNIFTPSQQVTPLVSGLSARGNLERGIGAERTSGTQGVASSQRGFGTWNPRSVIDKEMAVESSGFSASPETRGGTSGMFGQGPYKPPGQSDGFKSAHSGPEGFTPRTLFPKRLPTNSVFMQRDVPETISPRNVTATTAQPFSAANQTATQGAAPVTQTSGRSIMDSSELSWENSLEKELNRSASGIHAQASRGLSRTAASSNASVGSPLGRTQDSEVSQVQLDARHNMAAPQSRGFWDGEQQPRGSSASQLAKRHWDDIEKNQFILDTVVRGGDTGDVSLPDQVMGENDPFGRPFGKNSDSPAQQDYFEPIHRIAKPMPVEVPRTVTAVSADRGTAAMIWNTASTAPIPATVVPDSRVVSGIAETSVDSASKDRRTPPTPLDSGPAIWEYRDPSGATQGTFTGKRMFEWWMGKFLPPELPVRYSRDMPFVPLNEMFPTECMPTLLPFESFPEVTPSGEVLFDKILPAHHPKVRQQKLQAKSTQDVETQSSYSPIKSDSRPRSQERQTPQREPIPPPEEPEYEPELEPESETQQEFEEQQYYQEEEKTPEPAQPKPSPVKSAWKIPSTDASVTTVPGAGVRRPTPQVQSPPKPSPQTQSRANVVPTVLTYPAAKNVMTPETTVTAAVPKPIPTKWNNKGSEALSLAEIIRGETEIQKHETDSDANMPSSGPKGIAWKGKPQGKSSNLKKSLQELVEDQKMQIQNRGSVWGKPIIVDTSNEPTLAEIVKKSRPSVPAASSRAAESVTKKPAVSSPVVSASTEKPSGKTLPWAGAKQQPSKPSAAQKRHLEQTGPEDDSDLQRLCSDFSVPFASEFISFLKSCKTAEEVSQLIRDNLNGEVSDPDTFAQEFFQIVNNPFEVVGKDGPGGKEKKNKKNKKKF